MSGPRAEWAVVDDNGYFVTAPNETGGGRYISLLTENQAKLQITMYCKQGYRAKKLKVMP